MDNNQEKPSNITVPVKTEEADNENKPEQLHLKRKAILLVLVLVVIGVFVFMVGYILFTPDKSVEETLVEVKDELIVPEATPTPTPLPFEELTIPYLREKPLDGELGELEPAYSGSNFTAYLTSYTSEGLRVNALLTIPSDTSVEKHPAIVFVHGYIPPTQYQTNGEAYSSYVNYLASSGFVVLKIDLRGHGESEGEPGGGYYGADYVTDALNAREALRKADFVDPDRIGMWGHSMAGNIILRSLAAKPDIPAASIWSGAVYTYLDMRKYGIQDGSYRPPDLSTTLQNRRQRLFEKVGSPSAESVFWQRMAGTSYLNDLKGAISLHHAVDDDVVSIGYSRDLVELLNDTSIPHELHEYSSGGHNISGFSFNSAMADTVEFFKKYLSQ